MKIMLTLLATFLTATALTSSKPQASLPRAAAREVRVDITNTLTTNEPTHHPAATFIR